MWLARQNNKVSRIFEKGRTMRTKQARIMGCGLLLAVLLFSSMALAEADPNAPYPKGQRPTPCAWMQGKLGLSDEQVTQLEPLMTAHREAMKGTRELTQEKKKALDDAAESGAGDEAIKAAANDLAQVFADAAIARAAHVAELKKVLTAEQYEKWQQLKEARRERHQKKAGPGKGPGTRRGFWNKGEPCEDPNGPAGQKGRWSGRKPRGPRDFSKVFERKDADGDGKLSLQEFTATNRPTPAERFEAADADGDGFVTVEELKGSAKQFMGRRRPPQETD
jgi:Spy/CpxP family protein refolding chaperone